MSEEVRYAKKAVPRTLVWSIALHGCLAYAMIITVLFTMGPIENVLGDVLPIIEICRQATGSVKGATAMVAATKVVGLSAELANIASTSRLTWAWARDGGLPAWFSYVSFPFQSLRFDANTLEYRLTRSILSLSALSGCQSSLSCVLPVSTSPVTPHSTPSCPSVQLVCSRHT